MLMDIIQYILFVIQYPYQQNCWLIHFICRYIPLKQWFFDAFLSPRYRVQDWWTPLVTDSRQDWGYRELIHYYERHHDKKIRPISRRSKCNILDSCTCPRCDAPTPFLYRNNVSREQFLCKICDARFSLDEDYRKNKYKLHCIYYEFTKDFSAWI